MRSTLKYRLMGAMASEIWAIQPEALRAIEAAIMAMPDAPTASMPAEVFAMLERAMAPGAGDLEAAKVHPATERATARAEGGVAIIPFTGLITRKLSFEDSCAGWTATHPIRAAEAVEAAANDSAIKAIVGVFDSPGGISTGVPEAAARILAARRRKPMVAVVNGACASAAYWLAAGFDEIDVTPSGLAGSIGVYTTHDDVSAAMEQAGVKRTYISAGKFKVEGAPEMPLGEEAHAAIQARVDFTYGQFVDAVAKGRGVTPAVVRDGYGQGRVLMSEAAVEAGLCDRVRTFEDTMAAYGVDVSPADGRTAGPSAKGKRAMDLRRAELSVLEGGC